MRQFAKGLCFLQLLIFGASSTAEAETVAEANKAANPPMFSGTPANCKAEFKLKPAGIKDNHAFVVVTGPSGPLELRGGPSKGGSGNSSVPGLASPGMGTQPSGNPFNCTTTHEWGVVVPYVGKHGQLNSGPGTPVFSPDGNPKDVVYSASIGAGAQKDVCAMANCMMTVIKALGASCKIYTVGTGILRNSNTLISQALASCGVKDPLPGTMSATGWGNKWE